MFSTRGGILPSLLSRRWEAPGMSSVRLILVIWPKGSTWAGGHDGKGASLQDKSLSRAKHQPLQEAACTPGTRVPQPSSGGGGLGNGQGWRDPIRLPVCSHRLGHLALLLPRCFKGARAAILAQLPPHEVEVTSAGDLVTCHFCPE